MTTQKTVLNAVIGFPLDHTLSPVLHSQIYQDNSIDAVLLAFANQNVKDLIGAIKTLSIQLTAVTMPHKQTVIEYLDEIDDQAKKIKAVNTVINRRGKLFGYNTDITGVERALRGVEVKNKRVLLIGAGGAARTVACYLQQVGGLPLYLNRTSQDAQVLADEFGGQVVVGKDLRSDEIDIIINTTPVGMYPDVGKMPLDYKLLGPHQTVLDIIYNPIQTELLRVAKDQGATTISGLEMFVGQALEQVRLWQGKEITDGDYVNLLKKHLE